MEFEQIIKVIDKFNNSNLTELNIEEEYFKINLKSENKITAVKEVSAPITLIGENDNSINVNQDTNDENLIDIICPLVGTFYTAKSQDDEPFVKVGDKVKKGQIIGIVEAMKLMNEITATSDGIVEEIMVENEALVEYGQVILKLR